jgi:hypothetical protein
MNPIRIFCMIVPLFVFQCVKDADKPLVTVSIDGIDCAVCHGTNNQLVMATGQHAQHGPSGAYGGSLCEDCHPDNRHGHTAIDGIAKMKDGLSLTATSVCNGCHGDRASFAKMYWKMPGGTWLYDGGFCESCHDGSSIVNGIAAPNVMAHYNASGHGHTGDFVQTRHGKTGPGYQCVICHDPAAPGHFTPGAGDSMLRIANGSSGLCLDCHNPNHKGAGQLGLEAFSKASKHSSSVTKHYDYNYECDVCHNPHGTANLAMVRETIDGRLGAGPLAIKYTDSTMFDPSYQDTSFNLVKVNGVCNACHAPGGETHSSTNHPGNHHWGQACWQCHSHLIGFDTTGIISFIAIDPNPAQLNVGASFQLAMSANSNLGIQTDVSASATWYSGKPTIVTVNAFGNLNGVSVGTAFVYARYSGLIDSTEVQVIP